MTPPTLVWGASQWLAVAAPIVVGLLALLVWGYWRAPADPWVRVLAPIVKVIGILILAICLLEPLFSGTRAKPGANLFVVLTDNSQSMTLHDRDAPQTRADELKALVPKESKWLARIGTDFDLRKYAFDTQLRAVENLDALPFDGGASNLGAALDRLVRQYQGRPLAGVILLTDGSATDADSIERVLGRTTGLPPIYPVLLGRESPANDVNLQRIAVSQTNFEDAPVTLTAQITTSGLSGKTLVAQAVDESDKPVEEQKIKVDNDGEPITVRFRVKPEQSGVSFYRIKVTAPDPQAEATLANNTRLAAVDRGHGPYRILYVAGRPNWEFKFLQRAVESDVQVKLVGLLRVAKREPKFNYLGHQGESSNPLFRGFQNQNPDQIEQYDQPVLVPFTQDEEEFKKLRGGFPKSAEELFKYHAIIIDDLESEFFTQDQMQLVKQFVRERGGGLLMLGGQESFKNGKYDRTVIGDLLPVYADEAPTLPAGAKAKLALTKEGWLEPWVRLRDEETNERARLAAMPSFQTLNSVRAIKPGAVVLASAVIEGGETYPALVEQRFGRGVVGAMLIGDLWRWSLRKPEGAEDDLPKAWRQMMRWLVSDVPQRVEVAVGQRHEADEPEGSLTLSVHVRDPQYAPQDNAGVTVRVSTPDGKTVDLPAEASTREPGLYEAVYVPRQSGAYRGQVTALAPDGSEVGKVQAGWTSDPAADEFRDLKPNRELLDRIARATKGQTVAPKNLETFVASLPSRHADITEPYINPAWHQPWVLLLAIACLCAEWGLRRWRGLP
jgi:uncharacterized membrane protein